MAQTLKIAMPMAGFGTRLRPHTWSKPKPLLKLAGRTVLDYCLEQFGSLPDHFDEIEYVFIVGGQGDQIKTYMDEAHPDKKVNYVVQETMRGQSDALYQAREFLKGPMLMVFSDTLIEVDLSFLKNETADGVAVVKRVPDPRRFGAAILDGNGRITRLIEKPKEITNNLVVVGFYYFRKGEDLIEAIEEQVRRGASLNEEYFLADAVNILIEKGQYFRVEEIDTWLDAGTADSMFDTNRYLLDHGNDNSGTQQRAGVAIIPPVFIDPTAQIRSSVIGPYASVGADCLIEDAVVRDAIIDDETSICSTVLEKSLVGSHVRIEGQIVHYNLGDNTWVRK